MCVADCDGTLIGLLERYNPGGKENLTYKFDGGTITSELVYSVDGECWQRTLREPFAGEDKMMFFPSTIQQRDDFIYIIGSYSNREHGEFYPMELCSGVRIYRTPKDRLLALETSGEPGVLALREAVWHGGRLLWNLKAEKATMAIYDHTGEKCLVASHEDCIPFSGDSIAWEPRWKNRENLDDLIGKLLVFELKLENGSVWTLSGDYTLLQTTEAFRYQHSGIVPTRRGF